MVIATDSNAGVRDRGSTSVVTSTFASGKYISARRACLEGYRAVRALPSEQERMLDLFVAARAIVQARFVMTSAHPADRRMAPTYIRKVLAGLTQWLR